jgi:hypothetical protein
MSPRIARVPVDKEILSAIECAGMAEHTILNRFDGRGEIQREHILRPFSRYGFGCARPRSEH